MGIIFAENIELPEEQKVFYYIQHYFACFFGPIYFMGYCERFKDNTRYIWNPFIAHYGFVLFVLYMRYFLTPMSELTWANLNHTLCGIDTDPWRVHFGMHKYFYYWADFYLLLASYTTYYMNVFLLQIIKRVI